MLLKVFKRMLLILILICTCFNIVNYADELLDDVKVEVKLERSMRIKRYAYLFRLVYKNSSWSNIPLTNHFLNKYNPRDGICKNLDIVFVKPIDVDDAIELPNKLLAKVFLANHDEKYIIFDFIYEDDEDVIDDVNIIYVSHDDNSLNANEIYKKYLP